MRVDCHMGNQLYRYAQIYVEINFVHLSYVHTDKEGPILDTHIFILLLKQTSHRILKKLLHFQK